MQEQLASSSPFHLVLDDVGVVTEPEAFALLSLLIRDAPEGAQLVLASRNGADLPLARLRAAGEVLDLGATDLALDAFETRRLLAIGGLQPSDEAVHDICAAADGWAAGIALATLSGEGAEGLSAACVENSPDVARYLLREAVEGQSAEVRHFLLASSVLRRMSPALCDAALRMTDAANVLDALHRAGLFVEPLDADGEWSRYHHVFRELLQAELRRQTPEVIPDLLRGAAAWHEANGDLGEAFDYALEAGDLASAGRILLHSSEALIGGGEIETVRAWLERCTPEEIASDVQLALAGARVALLSGHAAEANRLTAVAETAGQLDAPSAENAASLRSSLADLRATLAPFGVSQMLRDAAFVCSVETKSGSHRVMDGWRGVATAHLLAGRPTEAVAAFARVLAFTKGRPDLDHITINSLGYSALAAVEAGDWRRARTWASEAHALTKGRGLERIAQGAAPFTAHAAVLQHDGLLSQATEALAQARDVIPALHAMHWFEADISLRCGDVALMLGDVEGSWELADTARYALAHYPDAGTLPRRLQALDARLRSARSLALTSSELRIVPFLPSHLSLQEIGDRIYLSRATVKTHTVAVYRKLDVSSRSEAVARLETLGFYGRTAS